MMLAAAGTSARAADATSAKADPTTAVSADASAIVAIHASIPILFFLVDAPLARLKMPDDSMARSSIERAATGLYSSAGVAAA